MGTRSERAVDLALALTSLVVLAGILVLAVSVVFDTRQTLPALGLVMLVVGLALASQFGVRPAIRQGRSPLRGTMAGLRRLFGFVGRMVGGRR